VFVLRVCSCDGNAVDSEVIVQMENVKTREKRYRVEYEASKINPISSCCRRWR